MPGTPTPSWAGAPWPSTAAVEGIASASYQPGLLVLREARLLAEAVNALGTRPDALLVDATGRDHPRRAGMALHLGAVLEIPTVGVTNRTLVAVGDAPATERLARSPIMLGDEIVGWWVRTRRGNDPVAVHAAWRTSADTAADLAAGLVSVTARPSLSGRPAEPLASPAAPRPRERRGEAGLDLPAAAELHESPAMPPSNR